MDARRARLVLEGSEVAGWSGVYVLGCIDRRVTIYSQQVRALNLAAALMASGRVKVDDPVVVVGAGAAGLMCAAGLACLRAKVTVLEAQEEILPLFRGGSTRWLHPGVYDWPLPGWDQDRSGLPLLDWEHGSVDAVREQLEAGWATAGDAVSIHHGVQGVRLGQPADSPRTVMWRPNGRLSVQTVILAVGFGLEATLLSDERRYWEGDDLDGSRVDGKKRRWLVSGCGDGALTDLFRLCLHRFRHDRMLRDYTDDPRMVTIRATIQRIENDAAIQDDAAALHDAYAKLEAPWVIEKMLAQRRNEEVTLAAPTAHFLTRRASPLNRFLAGQLYQAKMFELIGSRVDHVERNDAEIVVRFVDGTNERFDRIVRRHGPKAALDEHFPKIAEALEDDRRYRQAKPTLTDQTRERLWNEGIFGPEARGASVTGHVGRAGSVLRDDESAISATHLSSELNEAPGSTKMIRSDLEPAGATTPGEDVRDVEARPNRHEEAKNTTGSTAHHTTLDLLKQLKRASINIAQWPRRTNGKWIERPEEAAIMSWLSNPLPEHENGILFLLGGPGTGKSALLASIWHRIQQTDTPVLGIKADLIPANVDSLEDLRALLRLDKPVLESLAEAANPHGPSVLVIDQLDALCEVVDGVTGRLNMLLRLIWTISKVDSIRVVTSIRPFELKHEARLRRLHANARTISLGALTTRDLQTLLPNIHIHEETRPELLTPHALDLMAQLHHLQGVRFAFPSSLGQLRERFWRTSVAVAETGKKKIHDRGEDLTRDALKVARIMRETKALWIEQVVLEENGVSEDAIDKLIKHGLLRRSPDEQYIGFRHQTLYDAAQVRELIQNNGLNSFIQDHEQSLEVRPVVRSALLHLRVSDVERYAELTERLFTSKALHLRLLIVDTILESDGPSSHERKLFFRAVKDPSTSHRALNNLAQRAGWLAALKDYLPVWMSDYPDQTILLASAYLKQDLPAALKAMESAWIGTEKGRSQIILVLSRATRLPGEETDTLVHKLVPDLIQSRRHELGGIGQAIARADPQRAALLYLACIEEEGRVLAKNETVLGDTGASDELLELDIDPYFVMQKLEPIVQKHLPERRTKHNTYAFCDMLRSLLEALLRRASKNDAAKFLEHVSNAAILDDVLGIYLRVVGAMEGLLDERIDWVTAELRRLAIDPESTSFLEMLSEQITADHVRRLEDAIGKVELDSPPEYHEQPQWRRRRLQRNRIYRVHLRELLPYEHRSQSSLALDRSERRQLPNTSFEPSYGPRGGFVRSPLTAHQLARAGDDAVIRALGIERERLEFDKHGTPIGGPDEIVGQLGNLAKTEPERVAKLIEKLRSRGEASRKRARRMLREVLENHPNPLSLESLVGSLLAPDDAPLEHDDGCADALRKLTKHGALSHEALAWIFRRIEGASPTNVEVERETVEDQKTSLALFGRARHFGTIPQGAFRWLEALYHHLMQVEEKRLS